MQEKGRVNIAFQAVEGADNPGVGSGGQRACGEESVGLAKTTAG